MNYINALGNNKGGGVVSNSQTLWRVAIFIKLDSYTSLHENLVGLLTNFPRDRSNVSFLTCTQHWVHTHRAQWVNLEKNAFERSHNVC